MYDSVIKVTTNDAYSLTEVQLYSYQDEKDSNVLFASI